MDSEDELLKNISDDWLDHGEPDFINEKGVKFWLNKVSTNHAHFQGLKNINVFIVLETNESKTFLIVEDGQPIYENTSLEAIGGHLDILKLTRGL